MRTTIEEEKTNRTKYHQTATSHVVGYSSAVLQNYTMHTNSHTTTKTLHTRVIERIRSIISIPALHSVNFLKCLIVTNV